MLALTKNAGYLLVISTHMSVSSQRSTVNFIHGEFVRFSRRCQSNNAQSFSRTKTYMFASLLSQLASDVII
jgi:hypothetical protein